MKNYYAILGIKEGASLQEIKKAYKGIVKKWHPDFHPDDPECLEKIKDINEAYEVLSHSKKRRAYHQQVKEQEINYLPTNGLCDPMRIILFSPIL